MTAAGGAGTRQQAPRRQGAGAAEGGSPPYCNTGGKCQQTAELAIIDYLRFTFLPSVRVAEALDQVLAYFRLWFSLPVNLIPAEKGLFGYEASHDLMVWVNGEFLRLAIVGHGGHTANGTVMVDMSGLGCSMVSDWQAVFATMQDFDARITRVDTALDLKQGYSVDYFDDLYLSGEFNCGGRIPSRRYYEAGDSHDVSGSGRTLYLGKKVNGKELCIYEKGKQLGDPSSEWVRVEIRFGNRDRVIPHDVVLTPTKYFAGAFVALRSLVDSAAEKIFTDRKEVADEEFDVAMARMEHFLKSSYGKFLFQLSQQHQGDLAAMVERITVKGVPKRLRKAVAARVANSSVCHPDALAA